MKGFNTYIIEKLKIDKNISVSEKVTDKEAINETWKDTYHFLKKYISDLDEWKYYIYTNLKTVGEKYKGDDTHLLINFVYSFPQQLECEKIKELMEEDIVNIKTKNGKQLYNGNIDILPEKQNIKLYYNQ